jgi:hypothetical protein
MLPTNGHQRPLKYTGGYWWPPMNFPDLGILLAVSAPASLAGTDLVAGTYLEVFRGLFIRCSASHIQPKCWGA